MANADARHPSVHRSFPRLAPIAVDLICHVIRALKSEGWTILIVEENISQIVDFVGNIYLVDNGNFVWDGDPAEMVESNELLET